MPLPLLHLSVAHSLLDTSSPVFAGISPSDFYLGAISPDAIHMREGWTREDKRRIHVFGESKELPSRLQRFDTLMQDMRKTTETSFLFGWISHLVADALWSHFLIHGFWEERSAELSDESRRETYYRENDKIEYLFFCSVPWKSSVWNDLSRVEAHSAEQFLTADEINAWRDRYLRWHAEIGKEPEDDPVCFTLERTGAFIELAVLVCRTGFEQTFADAIDIVTSQYSQDYIGTI